MRPRGDQRTWTITVDLDETSEATEAKALLAEGDVRVGGWGRAKRNPADPDLPRVGEELAVARALNDLAHQLLERAAATIEQHEGGAVHPHD
jgi:hypothetical protein